MCEEDEESQGKQEAPDVSDRWGEQLAFVMKEAPSLVFHAHQAQGP